jgi:dTDP-4-amino-4,6-dideoxygalactose transaminase
MRVPLVDLDAQYRHIRNEINRAILYVLESGNFIMGKYVRQFEENFAGYNGCRFAISVANGTDALIIALKALGIGKDDEVITTPFTFFATAEAIIQAGARPVFVDIDPFTYNIDANAIEKKINENTRAIIPVHIFGNPAKMDRIMEIAKNYKLYVIEDACQAVGARYKGKRVGTIGDAGCFSFFPSKNLGCYGDGGMIVTDNEEVAIIARALRSHGGGETGAKAYSLINGCEEKRNADKYDNFLIGYNSRLDEIQAAVLDVKLRYLDEWNRLRRERAYYYNEGLRGYPLVTPGEEGEAEAVYHIYTLRNPKRDRIIDRLKEKGIASRVYYHVPLHLQKGLRFLGCGEGDFKQAESVIRDMFSIPIYPELKKDEQDFIMETIIESLS